MPPDSDNTGQQDRIHNSAALSERLPSEVRTMHPIGFRCGEWANVTGIVNVRGRACWQVEFPDGVTDQWVISDKEGRYEFR